MGFNIGTRNALQRSGYNDNDLRWPAGVRPFPLYRRQSPGGRYGGQGARQRILLLLEEVDFIDLVCTLVIGLESLHRDVGGSGSEKVVWSDPAIIIYLSWPLKAEGYSQPTIDKLRAPTGKHCNCATGQLEIYNSVCSYLQPIGRVTLAAYWSWRTCG